MSDASVIPEDVIERAAAALHRSFAEDGGYAWRGMAGAALTASGLPARVAELDVLARELCDALTDPTNYHWGGRGQDCECVDCSAKRALIGRARTVLNAKGAE